MRSGNLNYEERQVFAQLYANEADTAKYLPLFFENEKQLKTFIEMFRGKTIKIPTSYQEYLENYMKLDKTTSNRKSRGVNGTKILKDKIINSYLNLFKTLSEALKNECDFKRGGY